MLKLNQMIGEPIHDITHFAMEEAVRLTGSTLGYVAFMSENETELTMFAWSDTAMRECQIQDKPIVYPVVTTGLWGEAVRQRRAIVTNDYAAPNPWKKGFPEGHVSVIEAHECADFRRGPDRHRRRVWATRPVEYDERDVRQLTLLMSGLWTIIVRKRSEEALAGQRGTVPAARRQRRVSPSSSLRSRPGAVLFVNERACRLFELPLDEAIGRHRPGTSGSVRRIGTGSWRTCRLGAGDRI